MPHYTITLEIARPIQDMFAFFARPKNLLQFTPPDFNLELMSGPEILELGARLVWKGRRWGISQQITQLVATFDKEKLIVVEQMKGPFSRWIQAHHFEAADAGTRIVEKIDFAPPGGLLGLAISADSIRKELEKISAYRATRLKELFT
jgi:ligand-binding SRPBCC domain-containing protein